MGHFGVRNREDGTVIPVLRAGQLVTTLTGSFGVAVRETRITAVLGYLMAMSPSTIQRLFGFPGEVRSVGIETQNDNGRSDIHVETTVGSCVVEAKLDASDPHEQTSRYGARHIALLCHRRTNRAAGRSKVRYVHWEDLAAELRQLQRSPNPKLRLLSQDLLQYLEDKSVIQRNSLVEIYAREINEEKTLRLFLKARLYGCDYKPGSRLSEARYFTPHFGQRIATNYPGVTPGISYVAKVEGLQVVETWRELVDVLVDERGKTWFRKNQEFVGPLRRYWKWPKQRSFLLLGQPRLIFNPPIHKENIQAGKGFLSKQFLSFDELFGAWKK